MSIQKLFFYNYKRPSDSKICIHISETDNLTSFTGVIHNGESVTDLNLVKIGNSKFGTVTFSQSTSRVLRADPSSTVLYDCGEGDSSIPTRTVMLSGGTEGSCFFVRTSATPQSGTSVVLTTSTPSKKFDGNVSSINLAQNGLVYGFMYDADTNEWKELDAFDSGKIMMPHKSKPLVCSYIVGAYFTETGFFTPTSAIDTFVSFDAPAVGWTPGMPRTPDINTHATKPSTFVYTGLKPKFFHICAITNIEIKATPSTNFANIHYIWKLNGVEFGCSRKQSLTTAMPCLINAGSGVAVLSPGDELEATYKITDASSPVPEINFISNTFSITEFINYFEN